MTQHENYPDKQHFPLIVTFKNYQWGVEKLVTKYKTIDTETCDFDGGIVEIASIDLNDTEIDYNSQQSHFVNPQKPISISVMAIHHITNEMLELSPFIEDVIDAYKGADYPVAHNVDFDKRVMPEMDEPFICT